MPSGFWKWITANKLDLIFSKLLGIYIFREAFTNTLQREYRPLKNQLFYNFSLFSFTWKCPKMHLRAPNFQNFLGEHAPRPPYYGQHAVAYWPCKENNGPFKKMLFYNFSMFYFTWKCPKMHLRAPNFQNFLGGACPQTPLSWTACCCILSPLRCSHRN